MFPDHSNGAQRQNRSSVTLHNLGHASSKGYHKIESNKITLFRKVRLQIVVLLKIGLVRKMLRASTKSPFFCGYFVRIRLNA